LLLLRLHLVPVLRLVLYVSSSPSSIFIFFGEGRFPKTILRYWIWGIAHMGDLETRFYDLLQETDDVLDGMRNGYMFFGQNVCMYKLGGNESVEQILEARFQDSGGKSEGKMRTRKRYTWINFG
jgi:hypothetical protein